MNEPVAAPRNKRRQILSIIAIAFVVLGLAWLALSHFVLALREKTDDAYVAGHQVSISSQVPGTVVEVAVEDTTLVEPGQVLVRLDPVDAATALSRAQAQLGQAVRQVRQQQAMAMQYDALVTQRRLELARAQADADRRAPLVKEQAIAGEELRHARELVDMARAAVDQAQRQAAATHALVDRSSVENNPLVLDAKARYRDAWIAARRNAIVAPIRGYIAQRSVQLGQRVAPGQMLMTVISLDDLWVDANFKENQIRNLRIGQTAEIRSDIYGSDPVFHGKVMGLAPGTGGAFSLLPAQNASGNWIKVVQRVPVRVSLDPAELAKHPLRIGLSMTVTVDTHDRSGEVLAASSEPVSKPTTAVYEADMAQANAEAEQIVRDNSEAAH